MPRSTPKSCSFGELALALISNPVAQTMLVIFCGVAIDWFWHTARGAVVTFTIFWENSPPDREPANLNELRLRRHLQHEILVPILIPLDLLGRSDIQCPARFE